MCEDHPTRYHAGDTISPDSVRSHPVSSHTSATNVTTKDILEYGVFQQPLHHFSHRQFNPLPTGQFTCIYINTFNNLLASHPNRYLVNYIINGLQYGFDIGFQGLSTSTRPKNLRSAIDNKDKVSLAINKELCRGHTAGPFQSPPFPIVHCSPIGAVIKKDNTCRLVLDLSQPKGFSINEYILKEDFAVQYTPFDEATDLVRLAGQFCYLSKLDIKHAFRLIPVHPSQWHLLCYWWEGKYFVDTVLPFGLRSSPGIFNQFANLVCWVIKSKFGIVSIIHYADDFFLVSGKDIHIAQQQLDTVCQAFQEMGIPLAKDKIVGPVQKLTYLGIEINSQDLTIEITEERYIELMSTFSQWLHKKTCTKLELLSLIGKLSFVCKVVRPGRIFLRRLITLSTTAQKLHHVNLNKAALADIQWWYSFLPTWNKKCIIPETLKVWSSDIKLFTDASDLGFGAILDTAWIQGSWESKHKKLSIDYRELFAIVAAAITWGHKWEGKRIVFITDNLPITQIWVTGTSQATEVMSLVRSLFLIAAKKGFSVSLKHILGVSNPIADALSRFQAQRFNQLLPQADQLPTEIPTEVWLL